MKKGNWATGTRSGWKPRSSSRCWGAKPLCWQPAAVTILWRLQVLREGKKTQNGLKSAHFAPKTPFLFFYFDVAESGSVFAFGENKMGQLGLGNQTDAVPSPTQVSPFPSWGLGAKLADLGFFFSLKKIPRRAQTPLGCKDIPLGEGFISGCGGKINGKSLKYDARI